jgi:hypothetical protein
VPIQRYEDVVDNVRAMLQSYAEPAGDTASFCKRVRNRLKIKELSFCKVQKLRVRKCKRVRKNIKLKDLPFGAEKKSFVPGNGPQEAWSPKRRCKLTRTCVYHNSRRSLKGGRVRSGPVPDYAIDRLLKRGQGSRDQGRALSNHPTEHTGPGTSGTEMI